jgi:hypothetical protein
MPNNVTYVSYQIKANASTVYFKNIRILLVQTKCRMSNMANLPNTEYYGKQKRPAALANLFYAVLKTGCCFKASPGGEAVDEVD